MPLLAQQEDGVGEGSAAGEPGCWGDTQTQWGPGCSSLDPAQVLLARVVTSLSAPGHPPPGPESWDWSRLSGVFGFMDKSPN